jgi:hypothetical protein
MDAARLDLIIQLCTRIGIIMEDSSVIALTAGGGEECDPPRSPRPSINRDRPDKSKFPDGAIRRLLLPLAMPARVPWIGR